MSRIRRNPAECRAVIVSVAEMAAMIGLSRARFYQLMGSTFPSPIYDIHTKRPFFPEELQAVCRAVRESNCGVDGKPVLFYARRRKHPKSNQKGKRKSAAATNPLASLVSGLRSLGLKSVTIVEVQAVVQELYPGGIAGIEPGTLVTRVFLELKRRGRHP
jgi:hypothetical protein